MNKILIFLILILSCFSISCKDNESFRKVDLIEGATHDFEPLLGTQYSYILLKGKLDGSSYLTDMTFNNIITNTVQERRVEYYQVDYYNSNKKVNTYSHEFDKATGSLGTHRQNFFPYLNYDNSSYIKSFNVLVKYSYLEDGLSIKKQEKYKEEVIEFDPSKFETFDEGFVFINNTVEKETYYRFQVGYNLTYQVEGHIDMQVWLEYKTGWILPFVGIYHYPAALGDFSLGSDEKIKKENEIVRIYFETRHQSSDGVVGYTYYKIDI